jgi:hypothetical protein
LLNEDYAAATVRGGSFTGQAEASHSHNRGLMNGTDGAAILRGGSFTGRGGASASGIWNWTNASLEADRVTAQGEDGSSSNNGLTNASGQVRLRDGSFTGRGGEWARGLLNVGSGSILWAYGVYARGLNGSIQSIGLDTDTQSQYAGATNSTLQGTTASVEESGGTVHVYNSRLMGGAAAGAVTCTLVTWGTLVSTDGQTCP